MDTSVRASVIGGEQLHYNADISPLLPKLRTLTPRDRSPEALGFNLLSVSERELYSVSSALFGRHRIAEHADPLDLDFDQIARL